MNKIYKFSGFSLVELLTALAISALMILGIGQAFISQKVSYNTQNDMSRVQQTGRFAVEFISRDLRMAGFPGREEQGSTTFNAVISDLTAEGSGSNSDTFTVMYRTATDCLGNTTPTYADGFQYAKNQYSIVNGNLVCSTFGETLAAVPVPLATDVLARGVDNMQVLFGLGDTYVSASDLTVADWDLITGARVSFLINSIDDAAGYTDTNSYALLNADQLGPFNDSLRRRVFTTTTVLRNRLDLVTL